MSPRRFHCVRSSALVAGETGDGEAIDVVTVVKHVAAQPERAMDGLGEPMATPRMVRIPTAASADAPGEGD